MQKLTIRGREFTYRPADHGTYIVRGARGSVYLATPAYAGDAHTFKLITTKSELRIAGNAVRVSDATGELVEVRA